MQTPFARNVIGDSEVPPAASETIATRSSRPRSGKRGPRRRQAIVVLEGVALAVLVASGGFGWWPAVRALTVVCGTALAAWRLSRERRSRRSTGLAFVGLVGVISGVAVGIPSLSHRGAAPIVAVAGVIAIASGLTLSAIGVRSLFVDASVVRRLGAVALIAVVFLGVVAPITLAVFVTNVTPLPLGEGTPADIGAPYDDVHLQTADGVRLGGWYIHSTNGAAVVMLAGATGVRSDELDHAAVLVRHGYGVLLLDVRGHGDSEGDAMLWGWYGDADVRPAVDFLAARPEVQPGRIGVVGMSMGAEEAIGAAADDHRIVAVVAEGASARGARDEGDPARGLGGLLDRYFDWATRRVADLMTSASPPGALRSAIGAAESTHFFVIAAGTVNSEIAAADVFRRAAPDRVRVWIAAGAAHTEALDRYPIEWEQLVTAFLDTTFQQVTDRNWSAPRTFTRPPVPRDLTASR